MLSLESVCFRIEVHLPHLNFARQNQVWMDRILMCECDSMLHDNWLDVPYVIILHSFCFKRGMVSDKNTKRNIFTIIFLFSFHKGITAKR